MSPVNIESGRLKPTLVRSFYATVRASRILPRRPRLGHRYPTYHAYRYFGGLVGYDDRLGREFEPHPEYYFYHVCLTHRPTGLDQ